MPTVSICIPTYNHGKFIAAAIRSAMAQAYDDIEIVVLDNASEDDTGLIVATISGQDPRIRYIRHSVNLGLAGNLNACIRFARGKYVKVLCADDVLDPDCVSTMVNALDEHPSATLVGCPRKMADVALSPLRIAGGRTTVQLIAGQKMIEDCFFFGNQLGEPTAVMFRREEALRGFSQQYSQLMDMEMWFHLLKFGDFIGLSDALCTIRSHPGQATWTNDQSGKIVADRRLLFRQFSASAARSAGVLRKALWDFRMAYAMIRSVPVANSPDDRSISEVFFARTFLAVTYPLVRLMKRVGLDLIWKTA
jgi:glycosyltransferase involved in cell wall biosynthesis